MQLSSRSIKADLDTNMLFCKHVCHIISNACLLYTSHQQVEAAVAHIVQNRLDAGSVIHASGAELQRLKHFPPNSPSIACGCRQAPFLLFPQDGFFLDFVAGIKTFHYLSLIHI